MLILLQLSLLRAWVVYFYNIIEIPQEIPEKIQDQVKSANSDAFFEDFFSSEKFSIFEILNGITKFFDKYILKSTFFIKKEYSVLQSTEKIPAKFKKSIFSEFLPTVPLKKILFLYFHDASYFPD